MKAKKEKKKGKAVKAVKVVKAVKTDKKERILKELKSIVGEKNATADQHILYAYSYDMSFVTPKLPDYVVMAHTVEDGFAMVEAMQKHKRIVQVGSQARSSIIHAKAHEIYASGQLGLVTAIEACIDRNDASGAWVYPIPPDANEKTVDWIIGYEKGYDDAHAKPVFINKPEDSGKLIFNKFCINNLAVYLYKFKKTKICIIAKGCDVKSIREMITEKRKPVLLNSLLKNAPCELSF